jgi:short-subunit dehydrogenase involved in D-alanine esterification of teichoic acids
MSTSTMPAPTIDLRNTEEVERYFAFLNEQYPDLVEAINVMGIPYQHYLATLRMMPQQTTISTTSSSPVF